MMIVNDITSNKLHRLTLDSFQLQFPLGDLGVKLLTSFISLSSIAGAYEFYQNFKKWWLYIERLRKTFIIKDSIKDTKKKFLPCILMKIFWAYFHCHWFCCVKTANSSQSESNYTIKKWKDFSKEIPTISKVNLDQMKKMFVQYEYSPKYYCFPNVRHNQSPNNSTHQLDEERRSLRDEERLLLEDNNLDNQSMQATVSTEHVHDKHVKCKNMLSEPVFYLLLLDFEKLRTSDLVKDLRMKNKDEDSALKLLFQAVLEETSDFKFIKAYKNIQDDLLDAAKNVCLVLKNFPEKYKYNFKNEQKFLLEAVLDLNQKFNIQLIYQLQ